MWKSNETGSISSLPLYVSARHNRTCQHLEQRRQLCPLGNPVKTVMSALWQYNDARLIVTYNTHNVSRLPLREKPSTRVDANKTNRMSDCNSFGSVHRLEWVFDWLAYTAQNSSFASPPERPPIAIPGVSLSTISLQHSLLISRSRPPCMIQKRF